MKPFALSDIPAKHHAQIFAQLAPHTPHQGGAHMQLQEQQDAIEGAADNGPDQAEEDGALHPSYRVTVTLLVSDNRRRDADGALSSLMDSLVRAVGRLNPVGAGDHDKGSPRKQRAGRGEPHH